MTSKRRHRFSLKRLQTEGQGGELEIATIKTPKGLPVQLAKLSIPPTHRTQSMRHPANNNRPNMKNKQIITHRLNTPHSHAHQAQPRHQHMEENSQACNKHTHELSIQKKANLSRNRNRENKKKEPQAHMQPTEGGGGAVGGGQRLQKCAKI
ncbi:hypothetical protein L7F22_066311 [Adiantum nelumboides]|nr:hypothetical protein [Adiantum nelumboides]